MKFNAKKLLALLITGAMALSFAACDTNSGGSNNSDNSNKSDNQQQVNENNNTPDPVTPPEDDASANNEDIDNNDDASANNDPAPAPSSDLPTEAQDFDFVVMQFNCREFKAAESGGETFLGDNMDSKRNTAKDAIRQAFQQEHDFDPDSAYGEYEYLVFENGEFWENISHINATLYLDDVGGNADPACIEWCGNYVQLGGGSEPQKHAFDFLGDNFIEQFDETGFGFGKDFTGEVSWDIAGFMADYGGSSAKATFDEDGNGMDNGGGVLKFGLKIRNDDLEDYQLSINWTSVEIYVYDMDKFMGYVDEVSAITGTTMSENAKVLLAE